MEKTLKQIADEIGVSKQRVYRYVSQAQIRPTKQDGKTMYFSDAAQESIKGEFSARKRRKKTPLNAQNDITLDALMRQLEAKDKQIADLTRLLDQEQKLTAAYTQQIQQLLEDKNSAVDSDPGDPVVEQEQPKKWWQIWR